MTSFMSYILIHLPQFMLMHVINQLSYIINALNQLALLCYYLNVITLYQIALLAQLVRKVRQPKRKAGQHTEAFTSQIMIRQIMMFALLLKKKYCFRRLTAIIQLSLSNKAAVALKYFMEQLTVLKFLLLEELVEFIYSFVYLIWILFFIQES